jgi:CRISPR-associated protein (TIGR03986 family)
MSTQTIPSPYNFATVEDRVVLLADSEYPSIGIPFRDGLSGAIMVEFEATRPIYIRSAGQHDKGRIANALGRAKSNTQAILEDPDLEPYSRFYQLPNGNFALPGTSVKGMLRSVVEILSFSRMFGVQNDRYAIRDLNTRQEDIYKGWITKNSPNGFHAKPMAGWLHLGTDGEWHLQPCRHGRVEHSLLSHIQAVPFDKLASNMYGLWKNSLGVFCRFRKGPWAEVPIHSNSVGGNLAMSYVEEVSAQQSSACETPCTLVFTGRPTNKKHREFVFEPFRPGQDDPAVAEEMKADFLFLHEDQDDWKAYWKGRFIARNPIPVFYLATESETPTPSSTAVAFAAGRHIHSMGLCQMHRLAYARRVRDLLPPLHQNSGGMDIAEAIFGRVSASKGESCRGRVSVEPFPALDAPAPMPPHVAVLNGPKASYFPNYLKQEVDIGDRERHYSTYHDDDAELRGWKRYPAHEDDSGSKPLPNDPPDIKGKVNYAVATVFAPLPPETRFRGAVHFHNLRPWELGALLWAIRLGHAGLPEHNQRRHSIGMAKPLGCGLVKLNSIEMSASPIVSSALCGEAECMAEFEKFVLAKLGEPGLPYRDHRQVKDLLAMASIKKPKDPRDLIYPKPVKEFAESKKLGLILQPFENLPADPNYQTPASKNVRVEPSEAPPEVVAPEPVDPAPLVKVQIEVTGQNKKNRWKAQVVIDGMPASAVDIGLIEGDLPADIAQGKIYTAEVLGNTPSQWKFQIVLS